MEKRFRELLEAGSIKGWTDEKIENFDFDDSDEREALSNAFGCSLNCPVRKTCSKIIDIMPDKVDCQDVLMMFCAGIIELDGRE